MNSTDAGNVSLAVVSFGDSLKHGSMSLDSFMRAAVTHGLGAVELCDLSMRDPAVAVDLASRYDLGMPSVALRNDFTGSAEALGQQIEHLRSWMPIVRSVGGTVARVWTGWHRTDDVATKQIIDGFDAIVPSAIKAGVTIAVETHGGLSNDPDFVADLCARYPKGAVGACIDFGNLPAPDRRARIAAFIPLTVHVHVKSYAFRDGVETTVPLDWAIEELCRAGYDGQWVVEYEGEPPYDDGISQTVGALARAGVLDSSALAQHCAGVSS
jgi:sugar phosphate isomerase/epimerase